MKTNFFFMLAISIFGMVITSCNNPSPNKNKNIEQKNLPDTAGYYAAREMKGLASFRIGESTLSDVLTEIKEEIRKDSRRYKETNYKESPKYRGYEEKHLDFKFDKKGNAISSFYREDFGSIFTIVNYDTLSSYLKRDLLEREIFGCPQIKEIKMFEYFIGDIEIRNLRLKFYRDTLCEISCSQNDKVEEGFSTKYGDGKRVDNSVWKTPRGKTNIRPEDEKTLQKSQLLKIDENIIWENKNIKAESQTYIEYEYEGDKYKGARYSNSYFTIISKNKNLAKEMLDCENAAYEIKKRIEKSNEQNDINKL